MMNAKFNETHLLHELKHYLPSQAALKDFVHHNSLHAFQDLNFFEGIFKASKIFGFKVTFSMNEYRKLYAQGRIRLEILEKVIIQKKGQSELENVKQKMLTLNCTPDYTKRVGQLRQHWKTYYKIDLDNLVQPLLFRIIASYLDQGIALWHFPFEDKGLIKAIQTLEQNSFVSFFKSRRVKKLLFEDNLNIYMLLKIIVGDENYFEQYIYDQQFHHRGWSGIVAAIESNPDTLLYQKKIHLKDFILLELLLEIDFLDQTFGQNWQPLANKITTPPLDYFADAPMQEWEELLMLWQNAFEWDYYDSVLSGVDFLLKKQRMNPIEKKSFQAVFCIDDREGSLRRHFESCDPNCETLGAPGYFGVPFYFQPFGGKFYEKNCPVPVQPKHLVKELNVQSKRGHEILHSKDSHTFFKSIFASLALGVWASIRMVLDLIKPKMNSDIADAFAHMNINGELTIENVNLNDIENGLQIGFTIEEMADIVKNLLQGISLLEFAPIVYIIGHGSSSANNPHHGAHDCGACSGRPGSVNARVFAAMANHPKVREILKTKLPIPIETQFLGGMHDTASDEIMFYDEQILSKQNAVLHQQYLKTMEEALDLNAKERARRFASIDINKPIKHVRHEIKKRSVSYFEPRPELGHGTNALCYVGSRERIKGLFLDRRAFLNSYDYRTDLDGTFLQQVLSPLPGVCGGINLEYYFSRMDIEKMGAGTKLPHNVMGLIGVANSSDGDLRPGLPLQMIENHDPVRLLMMVEHHPEVILKIIKSSSAIYNWFEKEWIHLIAVSPEEQMLYYFKDGKFEVYQPISKVNLTDNVLKLIENTKEMRTNHIIDATKENIPVSIYNVDDQPIP